MVGLSLRKGARQQRPNVNLSEDKTSKSGIIYSLTRLVHCKGSEIPILHYSSRFRSFNLRTCSASRAFVFRPLNPPRIVTLRGSPPFFVSNPDSGDHIGSPDASTCPLPWCQHENGIKRWVGWRVLFLHQQAVLSHPTPDQFFRLHKPSQNGSC